MENGLKNGGSLPSATALRDSLNQKSDTSPESTMLTPYQKDLLLQGEGEIDESLNEVDEVVPFKYSITSYGADYPVDSLVKRISMDDILIPKFQRGYVWSLKEASRFVESLLLGLPVPSIFLSREPETQKLLVIDGQQRLSSLRYFYDGIWPSTRKEFALKGLASKFEGATYKSLAGDDRRRLDDSIVHAIVVKQDEPSDDSSSIYHIFERLNTSGVSLTPQEIRTAIHHGEFSDLLKELNAVDHWRAVYGPVNKLMRDQELILRFLALYYDAEQYSRPMKGFLNSFMGRNKHLTVLSGEDMRSAFTPAIEVIHKSIGKRAFRLARVLNAAVFDAVMVGIARRLRRGAIPDLDMLKQRYTTLLESPGFLAVAERATADEESVSKRLDLATAAFVDVP
jgi:hypothetical protein